MKNNIINDMTYIESRLFKILDLCMKKGFCNIDFIAGELGVTDRSIRNYIKQLNNDLGNKIANVVYKKGKGYRLEIYNQEIFDLIIEKNKRNDISLNSREDRVRYILEYLIDLEEVVTLEELAEEICVGRTTLINDFKVVKKILKSFNLNLINKQNLGMRIDEDELNTRLLILNYIYKEYRSDFSQSPYYKLINKNDLKMIQTIVLDTFKERQYFATEKVFQETINYIVLMLNRIKENKNIKFYEKKCEILMSYEEYELAKNIKVKIEEYFKYKINENEIIFLTLPLVSGNAPSIENSIHNSYIHKAVEELLDKIIEEICITTGMRLDDEELRNGLGYHLRFTLNRLLFNINIKNILMDDIKENYSLAYNIAKIAGEVIENEYKVSVSEDEVGYIAIHFGSYLERNNYTLRNIKRIVLVCETGLGTTKLLEIRLKKLLSSNIIIHSYSSIGIANIDLNSYDIILTTIKLDIETKTPILKIDAIFDENKLKKQLEHVLSFDGNRFDSYNSTSLLNYMISSTEQFMILSRDNIIECLDDMIDNLIEFQYVDSSFKEKIKKRELKSPTAFDNGLFLPHAEDDNVEEIMLSIGVLDNPIIYNNKIIKLIVLLVMPSKEKIDSDLLVKIYDDLLRVGQDKKKIEAICKEKSFNSFKTIISSKSD